MSAWRTGARAVTRRREVFTEPAARRAAAEGKQLEGTPAEPGAVSIDALIAWIPGEVIATYTAIVLALQPELTEGADAPPIEIVSEWWLVAAVVAAAVLTWLGGWSASDNLNRQETRELAARVLLAAIAFLIWSFVVPGSWWYSNDDLAENQEVVALVAVLVGAGFGLFAEGLVRRVGR
jgi:hypothetical protein